MITPDKSGRLGKLESDRYLGKILAFVEQYERCKGIYKRGDGVVADERLLHEVIRKTHDDLFRYTQAYNFTQQINSPNHFKQAGHLAFWLRRLRPLSFDDEAAQVIDGHSNMSASYLAKASKYLNDEFSLLIGAYISVEGERSEGKEPTRNYLRGDILHDMIVICRYKSVSPHALTLFYRACFDSDT